MITTWTKAKVFAKFALRDIECGHHSGFRPCCIFCYAILDNLSTIHKRRFNNGRRYVQRIISRVRKLHFGYIPCPICLFREPVKVLRCKAGEPEHRFNFISGREMMIYNLLKDENPVHEGLRKIDQFMDRILKEKDEPLWWY